MNLSRKTEQRREYFREWVKDPANQQKHNARTIVFHALKKGKITRPAHCEKCNSPASVQAHHSDYSKPLDITWLCAICHGGHHRKSHCIRGHLMTPDNLYVWSGSGKAVCRACRTLRVQSFRAAKALVASARDVVAKAGEVK